MDLADLNIVSIPVNPKNQPTKKKKNNKYERRRRKAQHARQGKTHQGGNSESDISTPTKSIQTNDKPTKKIQNAKEEDCFVKSSAVEFESGDAMKESETLTMDAADKIETVSPTKAIERQDDADNKIAREETKSKSLEPNIENEERERESKAENIVEYSPTLKASRRNRAKAKEDFKEQEEDRAKYMAEFHARPMELDRRSGARSSIRISKESSHLFVADDWESLKVNPRLIRTMTSRFGLVKPTTIQTKTIQAVQGSPKKNVLVHSETGSGKT
jgi:hypothetical protein